MRAVSDLFTWFKVSLLMLFRPLVALSYRIEAKKLSKEGDTLRASCELDDVHQHHREFVEDAQRSADIESNDKGEEDEEEEGESTETEAEKILLHKSDKRNQFEEISQLRQIVEHQKELLSDMEAKNSSLTERLSSETTKVQELQAKLNEDHELKVEMYASFVQVQNGLDNTLKSFVALESEVVASRTRLDKIENVNKVYKNEIQQSEEANRLLKSSVESLEELQQSLKAEIKDAAGEIKDLKAIIECSSQFAETSKVETLKRLREKDEVISSLQKAFKVMIAVQKELDEILNNN